MPQGVDPAVQAKRVCMLECLSKHFGGFSKTLWHVISIGDKEAEAVALRECCKEYHRRMKKKPLCKTLTLPEEPMIADLGRTIETVESQLPSIVGHGSDIHATLSNLATSLAGS